MARTKKNTTDKCVKHSTAVVLDTSVLLYDPTCLFAYPNHFVVIPVSVLEELDKHKERIDEVGRHAKQVNRTLYSMKDKGRLHEGYTDPEHNITFILFREDMSDVPAPLDGTIADNRILSVCFSISKKEKISDVYLVTKDLNLALKAEAYGIRSTDYIVDTQVVDFRYTGHRVLEATADLNISEIYSEKSIPAPKDIELFQNEFCLIKSSPIVGKQSVRVQHKFGELHLLDKQLACHGIKPLNNEQYYAMHLLLDPKIRLVSLTGSAGTGKTLCAIACGLEQVIGNQPSFEKMTLSRSLVVMSGKDRLGFLKGGLEEKLQPYLLPLKDAVEFAIGGTDDTFEYLTTKGKDGKRPAKIEIEPLQFIRGRSLRDAFFIVDEAQNLTPTEIKTIITRIADSSKVILLGDLDQIDHPYLSKETNGLAHVIRKFKDSPLAGHVHLIEGVRSELATEAAELL